MLVIFFILGLAIGSFANVCILRLPSGQSIRRPASHCLHCLKPLQLLDNIPIFSFLFLKGRCRYCHTPISWQYILIEAAMGLAFLWNVGFFDRQLFLALLGCFLTFYLLVISIIDWRHRIIPDEMSISLIVAGILIAYWNPLLPGEGWERIMHSCLATVCGGSLMLALAWGGEKVFKKEALGGGDVKLIAAFGALLGWEGTLGSLLLGSLSGGLVGLVLLGLRKKRLGETIPFGPFLCLGAAASYYWPGWWSKLFGFVAILNFP